MKRIRQLLNVHLPPSVEQRERTPQARQGRVIVVLFESLVAPGVESFCDMYRFVVGERLGADEPGALRQVEK
jgi:hypothetical protein